ncbi:hypothetical protein BBW65_00495 [Helicobacter enhydrae]|uniref:Uncharacterized protein n=1 Tax=Helicobacter enhydrae TaxID=222136 RepID=A0A1B1U3Q8_9HELI|nr:phosphoribosyltransferase family protein [Helicobacter enhydrae]ANV97389.1 hypothetical protein BBW65_00495 [Helicobacter enhydrae]
MDKLKNYFENRQDALRHLFLELETINLDNTLVVALCPEGAIMADAVARHFDLEMEYLFCAPIPAPLNPECAIALVGEFMDVVIDENLLDSFGIPIDYVYQQAKVVYEEKILQNVKNLRKNQEIAKISGRNILIVDEGIETGFSVEVIIKTCVNAGCKSASVAVPVLSKDVENYLLKFCDCVYSVLSPDFFVSTNYYYTHLPVINENAQGFDFCELEAYKPNWKEENDNNTI